MASYRALVAANEVSNVLSFGVPESGPALEAIASDLVTFLFELISLFRERYEFDLLASTHSRSALEAVTLEMKDVDLV